MLQVFDNLIDNALEYSPASEPLHIRGYESPNGVVWCDGRRRLDISVGSRVEVTRGSEPVRFARLHHRPFTDRLVAKFGLPVQGWRGHGD